MSRTNGALHGCHAVKFDSCNNMLSSVHTMILQSVSLLTSINHQHYHVLRLLFRPSSRDALVCNPSRMTFLCHIRTTITIYLEFCIIHFRHRPTVPFVEFLMFQVLTFPLSYMYLVQTLYFLFCYAYFYLQRFVPGVVVCRPVLLTFKLNKYTQFQLPMIQINISSYRKLENTQIQNHKSFQSST